MSPLFLSLLPANAGMSQVLRLRQEPQLSVTPVPACLDAFSNQETAFGAKVRDLVRDWVTVQVESRKLSVREVLALATTHYSRRASTIPHLKDFPTSPSAGAIVVRDGKIVSGINLFIAARLLSKVSRKWADAQFECVFIAEKR